VHDCIIKHSVFRVLQKVSMKKSERRKRPGGIERRQSNHKVNNLLYLYIISFNYVLIAYFHLFQSDVSDDLY